MIVNTQNIIDTSINNQIKVTSKFIGKEKGVMIHWWSFVYHFGKEIMLALFNQCL